MPAALSLRFSGDATRQRNTVRDARRWNLPRTEGQERVREAYGSDKYDRLQALKRKYDPGNLFCLNQNIPPG